MTNEYTELNLPTAEQTEVKLTQIEGKHLHTFHYAIHKYWPVDFFFLCKHQISSFKLIFQQVSGLCIYFFPCSSACRLRREGETLLCTKQLVVGWIQSASLTGSFLAEIGGFGGGNNQKTKSPSPLQLTSGRGGDGQHHNGIEGMPPHVPLQRANPEVYMQGCNPSGTQSVRTCTHASTTTRARTQTHAHTHAHMQGFCICELFIQTSQSGSDRVSRGGIKDEAAETG